MVVIGSLTFLTFEMMHLKHRMPSLLRFASTAVKPQSVSVPTTPKHTVRKPGGKDIVLVEGVRTPFLVSGTDFKGLMPHEIATEAARGLAQRVGLDKSKVNSICFGTVIQVRQFFLLTLNF